MGLKHRVDCREQKLKLKGFTTTGWSGDKNIFRSFNK